MTSREMRRFQRVLQDHRVGLLHAVRQCLDRRLYSPGADAVGEMAGLSEQEQELVSRIFLLTIARLRDLENALHAIRQGSFGRCASCDGDIPLDRLQAVPWTSRCARCRERTEGLAAQFEMEDRNPQTERDSPSCEYCARRRTSGQNV